MNKRNKDILHLSRLLKKITSTALIFGIGGLKNKLLKEVYLNNLRQVDSNLYIWKSNDRSTIGFKTFYCGVNTFVPKEFKNYWISDHHIISVFYRFGMYSMNLISHNGEIYKMQFRRNSVPWNCNIDSIRSFLSNYILLNGINQWIDLFYSNNDEKILVEQGFVYPEFKLVDRDVINDIVKLYQMQFNIKKIADARENFKHLLEKNLSSLLIG